MKTIDTEALVARRAAERDLVVLEALPARYYDAGHLPGARHFPHDEATQRAPAVVPDRATPVVVYCANRQCRNSHVAAARLVALGYEDVSVYEGGKEAWAAAGMPLEQSPAAVAAA
jgi:rhodanese-related sulfurtransferase